MKESGVDDPDKFALDAAMMPQVLLAPTGEKIDEPGMVANPEQSGGKP
jgi:hypothetical protein